MGIPQAQNIKGLEKLSKTEEQDIADLLTRSRIQMLMTFPFFGILALNLKMVQDYSCPTAATDGKRFIYNPHFIKKLDEGEINWIVVHEVMHPALKHIWRKGDKQHQKWNVACDYAIHDIMMQFKDNADYEVKDKLKMPEGCLYDKQYENMSAEQIYDVLPDMPSIGGAGGSGEGGDQGSHNGGYVLDDHSVWDNPETQQGGQAKEVDWEGRMVSAAKSAEGKNAGNVPGFLKRLLGKLTKPQKDWRILLAEFVQPMVDDYSFNPPDRRFQNADFFLPDFNDTSEHVEDIEFWVDTSGSMSDHEIALCYSEICGAINQFKGNLRGRLCFFDHATYGPHEFDDIHDVTEIIPRGGGGTSFNIIFNDIQERNDGNNIAGIVILTDGYASFPESEDVADGIPVLWIVNNEEITPPWGLHTTIKP